MDRPPDLVDRTALARHRARAAAMTEPALFLFETVADEVQERLTLVNRAFTAAAVVTAWPDLWQARLPDAKAVRDDDVLALEPGCHDLVVHFMALHWSNDPVGQLIQARRALQADGMLLAVLFGGQTLAELRACLAEAEAELTGGLSPRVAPMGEIRDLGALLQRAGFALPVADNLMQRVSYGSALDLMRDLRAMGESNALAGRSRSFAHRRVLLRAAEIYAQTYGDADGRIPAQFEMIFLTGWAPDASQPQPLRPGSATSRLADVLGTDEVPLPGRTMPQQD